MTETARMPGGSGVGRVPYFFLQTRDPDRITEAVAATAPGARIEAVSRRGFSARVTTWQFSRTGLLRIEMAEGRAVLPGDRDYASLTVSSAGVCLAHNDPRTLTIEGDAAHVLGADEPTEFQPVGNSHVLGTNLDTSLFTAHMGGPAAVQRGGTGRSAFLIPSSPKRNSLRRFTDWVFGELQRTDSSLHDTRIGAEVESVLAAMLVEACCARDGLPARPGDDALRRAEELLAASVSKSVSLAEVAAAAGVSVRTLTRGFRERHGVGPIGFLHRRRLEAARRDLIDAVPGTVTVTEVANRYCLAHTGRFAIAYRRAFDESPSETLRR